MVDFDETRFSGYRAAASIPCDEFRSNLAVRDLTRFAHSSDLMEAVGELEGSRAPELAEHSPQESSVSNLAAALDSPRINGNDSEPKLKPTNGNTHAGRDPILHAEGETEDATTNLDRFDKFWPTRTI